MRLFNYQGYQYKDKEGLQSDRDIIIAHRYNLSRPGEIQAVIEEDEEGSLLKFYTGQKIIDRGKAM